MTAEVDICNLALGRIGVSERIASLNERSKSAVTCRGLYAQSRDAVLRDFAWPFATRFVQLAEVAGTVPGWQHQYRYPSDCLFARTLTSADGDRLVWINRCRFEPGYSSPIQPPRVPYRLASDAEGRLILTDLDEPWLTYTARVEDPTLFDPLFVSALAWHLALELVMPMSADQKRTAQAEQKYQIEMSKAAADAANEEQGDPWPESPSITVRW